MGPSSNTITRLGKAMVAVVFVGLLAGFPVGCKFVQSKSGERLPLKMVVFIPQLPEEAADKVVQGLQMLLDPYEAMPSLDPGKEASALPPPLLLPEQVTVRRLDCPEGSELKISAKEWQQGFMMKVTQALGNPTAARYRESWRQYGLERITVEALKGMGPAGKEAAFSTLESPIQAEEGTFFYLVTPQGKSRPDQVPASIAAAKATAVSSPAALWQHVYARLSKPPRPKELRLVVYYDPFARFPTVDTILAAYRAGEYARAKGLLGQAQESGQNGKLKDLIKNTPTVKASLSYLEKKRTYQAEITEGLVLTQDTPYALQFELSQGPAHLYVVQIDAVGKVNVVYPNIEWSDPQELQESITIRCPKNLDSGPGQRWFRLDENRGLEKLYILAAFVENQQISRWIRENQTEELKHYLQGLEQNPPSLPGIFFQVLAFTHR